MDYQGDVHAEDNNPTAIANNATHNDKEADDNEHSQLSMLFQID